MIYIVLNLSEINIFPRLTPFFNKKTKTNKINTNKLKNTIRNDGY
jgi:hypothetical protein